MREEIKEQETSNIGAFKELLENKEKLIKNCIVLELALERIKLQEELNELSWNDWNFVFLEWSFSGKKVLLDKIDQHIREIEWLESDKSLAVLQEWNQLFPLTIEKMQKYQSSNELLNNYSALCEKYFNALRHQCPKKPPSSFNYTDEIGEKIDQLEEKLDNYLEQIQYGQTDYTNYALNNTISDDLRMIDMIFKVRDGNVGKYIYTIPPCQFLLYIAENIYNYFTPKPPEVGLIGHDQAHGTAQDLHLD